MSTDLHTEHGFKRSWRYSDRLVPRTFVQPVMRFMRFEVASGVLMLAAAVIALVWANSPWFRSYEQIWSTPLTVQLGSFVDLDEFTLRTWVNDAAMALFFLLAGLEIKRQLTRGELADRRAAALPALAALGGMVVPALIYLAINQGHPGQAGWGIPVATDIAFAVGVVTLVGRRVPIGAKIFILTLAVVDDIGGILVIAVFYAEQASWGWLAVAAASVAVTVLCQRADIRSVVPYVLMGGLCWLALHEAGIEAAIVGVIFGLLAPIEPFHDPRKFAPAARTLVEQFDARYDDGLTAEEREQNEAALSDLVRFATESMSPGERVEERLGLWVTMLVVPVFAFANAGVRVETGALDTRVVWGVVLGLVLGKTIGVFGFSWLAVRLGIGQLPTGTTWRTMLGLGIVAGIGFTVALYVTGLSFPDSPALTDSAKLGVLAASLLAGVLGLLYFALVRPPRSAPPSASG